MDSDKNINSQKKYKTLNELEDEIDYKYNEKGELLHKVTGEKVGKLEKKEYELIGSYVEKYVAKPGFSEHQTGLAIDVGSRSTNVFANSKEYKWMLDNSYKYGYIIRYEKKYEHMTLFRAEPWHYRYVGKKIAKEIHDKNITLEEYAVRYLDK